MATYKEYYMEFTKQYQNKPTQRVFDVDMTTSLDALRSNLVMGFWEQVNRSKITDMEVTIYSGRTSAGRYLGKLIMKAYIGGALWKPAKGGSIPLNYYGKPVRRK